MSNISQEIIDNIAAGGGGTLYMGPMVDGSYKVLRVEADGHWTIRKPTKKDIARLKQSCRENNVEDPLPNLK